MGKNSKVDLEGEARTVRIYSHSAPAALDVPAVTWYKDANLRSLYMRMPILMLCCTINGYDGSLLNGLQTMDQWQACKCCSRSTRPCPIAYLPLSSSKQLTTSDLVDFGNPSGSTLGLITAIINIGAFTALFICKQDLCGKCETACHWLTDDRPAPYIADIFGRRVGTAMGNVILIVGIIIQCKSIPARAAVRPFRNLTGAVA